MRIVTARPPNYDEILAVFPAAATEPSVMFCYGDTIYNPSGEGISEALLAHEGVHSLRQGDDPAVWWARYLKDTQFRFQEELLAHVVEYRAFVHHSRRERRWALTQIAKRLSGPLYGRVTTREQARNMIRSLAAAEKVRDQVTGVQT